MNIITSSTHNALGQFCGGTYMDEDLFSDRNLEDMFIDKNNKFLRRSREMKDYFDSNSFVKESKQILRELSHVNEDDVIFIPKELNKANLLTQRYIMAGLEVREKRRKQVIQGFVSTYEELEPETIDNERIDYLRVMSGLSSSRDDEEDYGYVVDSLDEEEELAFEEKNDVLDLWRECEIEFYKGNDPTDN